MSKIKKTIFMILTLTVLTASVYAADAKTKLYEYVGEFRWAAEKTDEGQYYYFGINHNDDVIDYKVLLADDSFNKESLAYDLDFKIYLDKDIKSAEAPKIVAMHQAKELIKVDRFAKDGKSYDGTFSYFTDMQTQIVDLNGVAVETEALEDAILQVEYRSYTGTKTLSVLATKITLLETAEEKPELTMISNIFDKDLVSEDKAYKLIISEDTVIIDEEEKAYEGELTAKALDVYYVKDENAKENEIIEINAVKIIVKKDVDEELPVQKLDKLIVNDVEIEGAKLKLDDESNVLVPLRIVAEALDLEVVWNAVDRTVEIENIRIFIDTNVVSIDDTTVNGKGVVLVSVPVNEDGTLYVSLDFFTKLLDAKVSVSKDGIVKINNN